MKTFSSAYLIRTICCWKRTNEAVGKKGLRNGQDRVGKFFDTVLAIKLLQKEDNSKIFPLNFIVLKPYGCI